MKKLLLLCLLSLCFCVGGLFAQEEANCGINAWITDKDPKGLNVRNQPNVKGKIIANLPRKSNEDDDIVTVYITGYSNGWVKIARAETVSGKNLFDDIGWVSAKMAETSTAAGNATIYATANLKSKKIGIIPSESNVKISGFSCGWIKVIYKGKTGWIQAKSICGNPVTTCS